MVEYRILSRIFRFEKFMASKNLSPTSGIDKPYPIGPEPSRKNLMNSGPARTRTEKISEIPDQLGPGPKISRSRTGPDPTKF